MSVKSWRRTWQHEKRRGTFVPNKLSGRKAGWTQNPHLLIFELAMPSDATVLLRYTLRGYIYDYEEAKIIMKLYRPNYRVWNCRPYLAKTSWRIRPNKIKIRRSEMKREWNEWLGLTRVREWMHDRLRKCMCRHVTIVKTVLWRHARCVKTRDETADLTMPTDGLHLWRSSL